MFLGAGYYGFLHGREHSVLRLRGYLTLEGNVSIAAGNRWDVGPGAHVVIGARTYFSPDCTVIASSSVTVGASCAVGWGVQLLDDDFHHHGTGGTVDDRPTHAPITIGDHVWIGSHVKVLRGVSIADGCIIAAGSIVTRSFDTPRSLIAGSPAKVVRRDVDWT